MDMPEFKEQALELLSELEKTVPFVKKVEIESEHNFDNGKANDFLIGLNVNGQNLKLLGTIKSHLQPRLVHEVVRLLKEKGASFFGEIIYPIVVSEFISPRVAEILKEQRVSYFDLCGNCWLCFATIYIEKTGKKHKVFERREIKSLFALKSSRLIRLLLRRPHLMWQVEALSKKTKLSLGQVSNIRRALLDQQYAKLDEGGIKLIKPEALLNSLALAYKKNNVKQTLSFYTLLNLEEKLIAIKQAMAEAKGKGSCLMFSGLSAARYQSPFTTSVSETFYADKGGIECLKKYLQLAPVKAGANVIISEPKDDFIFQEAEESVPDILCTSPTQTYLDLFVAGEREKEAAEHLLNHFLKNRWKELQKE